MQTISAFDNAPATVLDVDVATSATVRSNVFHNALGAPSCSVEVQVTLLGAQPVNLAMKWRGQNSSPAVDPVTLPALNVVLPDTSAIAVSGTYVFVLPIFTAYSQLEVNVSSGGNVHVKALVQGCSTQFADYPASSGSGVASHVTVDSSALPTGASSAAKQPALGTAGSASTDVITVQGIASGTAQPVSVGLPASLSDQVQGTVGTSSQVLGTSQTLQFGCYVTNTHAQNTLTLGSSNVGVTRFVMQLLPGERSPLIPVANFTGVFVLGSAAGTTYSFGGC